mmetsp:Transcript_39009/g.84872  ORF Transcript_39009/g.84872 Transcript_39009/m.84872 type:complete len:370 (-) Transcript_39009:5-1114(-)
MDGTTATVVALVVAVASFALGCLSTFLYLRRTLGRQPSFQETLLTAKNLEIISSSEGNMDKRSEKNVSLGTRSSALFVSDTPPRPGSLRAPLANENAGVQVASTATEIANSLMLMSQNLPDELKASMLEIASQILYDRNLHDAVVEWNPGESGDTRVMMDDEIKDWLAQDYSICHTVHTTSPRTTGNTDVMFHNAPITRTYDPEERDWRHSQHTASNPSHSKRSSQIRFQTIPSMNAGTPTSASISRRSSEPGVTQPLLQMRAQVVHENLEGGSAKSTPYTGTRDSTHASTDPGQSGGFYTTSTAEEIVGVLTEIAQDLPLEKQLGMYDIASKIMYKHDLHSSVVDYNWPPKVSTANVDAEIQTWLPKD